MVKLRRIPHCRLFDLWWKPVVELNTMQYGLHRNLFFKQHSHILSFQLRQICKGCKAENLSPIILAREQEKLDKQKQIERLSIDKNISNIRGRKHKNYRKIEVKAALRFRSYQKQPYCPVLKVYWWRVYDLIQAITGLDRMLKRAGNSNVNVEALCNYHKCDVCWVARTEITPKELHMINKIKQRQNSRLRSLVQNYAKRNPGRPKGQI